MPDVTLNPSLAGSPPPNVPNPSPSEGGGVLVEYEAPDGTIQKITLDEAKNRLKTYAGKSNQFDAVSKEKADLEAKFKEADALANMTRKQKDLMTKAQEGDVDAFRELGSLLGVDSGYIEQQIATVQERSGTSGNAPAEGGYAALPPEQLALLQEVKQLLGGWKKAGIDPIRDLQGARQFQEETTSTWAKDATKNFLVGDLTDGPVLSKMVQHPTHGPKILDKIWARVDGWVKSGERKFTPETIREAAKDIRGIVDAFDAVFPAANPNVGPGSFGSAPAASFSRLEAPKEPQLKDYGDSNEGFAQYFNDLANYQNAQSSR